MGEVIDLKLGVKIAEGIISILAFAFNIIFFTESENDVQAISKCNENRCMWSGDWK